jgi:vitamin B12 transporter
MFGNEHFRDRFKAHLNTVVNSTSFVYWFLLIILSVFFSTHAHAANAPSQNADSQTAAIQTANSDSEYEKKQKPAATVLVSATRREIPIEKATRAVTVITREEIERSGKVFLIDLLRGVPGVTVVQLGTFGREVNVFIRGVNKESTLVQLDGVQINNANQSLAALQHITTANIERIEIVRGTQSVLYGADAVGGLINIVTKPETREGIHGGGKFSYGTYETFYEEGNLSGSNDRLSLSAVGGRMDSQGLADNDDYDNTTARAHGKLKVTDNSNLDISFHHFNSLVGIDDGLISGRFRTDPNRSTRANQEVINTKYDVSLTDWWKQYVQYSLFHDRNVSLDPRNGNTGVDPESSLKLNSNRHTFEYQSDFYIRDFDVLTVGYEFEHSAVESKSTTKYDQLTRNHGWFAQNELTLWEFWTIVTGARFDRHELYGTEVSPLVSTGIWIAKTMTKFKGSYGKGFRAPTFNQLFFPNFGVPTLQPETSWNWDAGFEQFYWDKRASFSAMYFDYRIRNLIQNLALATNTGSARSQGIELEHRIKIWEDLYFNTNYTYTHSIDRATEKRLFRVPRHAGKFGLSYDYKRLHFTGDWIWIGSREDSGAVKLKGYTRLDLALFYDLKEYWQIFTRVDNATNDDFKEANGFNMPLANFTVGTKAQF